MVGHIIAAVGILAILTIAYRVPRSKWGARPDFPFNAQSKRQRDRLREIGLEAMQERKAREQESREERESGRRR